MLCRVVWCCTRVVSCCVKLLFVSLSRLDRKEYVLIKYVLLISFSKSLSCKDMVELCYVNDVLKQPFADILQKVSLKIL